VLERDGLKVAYTAFQKLQWFSPLKCFTLAIVLTELCGRADMPNADLAWKDVDTWVMREGHGRMLRRRSRSGSFHCPRPARIAPVHPCVEDNCVKVQEFGRIMLAEALNGGMNGHVEVPD
jgi:hypothetical protein